MLGYKHKDIIFELNRQAFRFAQQREFKKGWNKELWKSELWKTAKSYIILYYIKKQRTLKCYFCGKVIFPIKNRKGILERYKCALHHISYNIRHYFSPKYVKLAHHRCHEKFHREMRNLNAF